MQRMMRKGPKVVNTADGRVNLPQKKTQKANMIMFHCENPMYSISSRHVATCE